MEDWWQRYEEANVTRGYVLKVFVKMVLAMGFLRWQAAKIYIHCLSPLSPLSPLSNATTAQASV